MENSVTQKQCNKCDQLKSIEDFYLNKSCRGGRNHACASCISANNKEIQKRKKQRREKWEKEIMQKEKAQIEKDSWNWGNNWVCLGENHWIDATKLNMIEITENGYGKYDIIIFFGEQKIPIYTEFTDKEELKKYLKDKFEKI